MKICNLLFIKKNQSFVVVVHIVTAIFDLEFQKFALKCRLVNSVKWQGQKKIPSTQTEETIAIHGSIYLWTHCNIAARCGAPQLL